MIDPLFILDEPQYHQWQPGSVHAFRGIALAVDGDPFEDLEIVRDGEVIATGAIDIPTPELATLPVPGSAACRFECTTVLDSRDVEIRGRSRDGRTTKLFDWSPPYDEIARMRRVSERVLTLPFPPPDIVATTQGGTNVDSYANSAVSGLFTLKSLLRESGCDPESMERILDIGCGTGRSLVGWHADDPRKELVGADINADLIGWAQRELSTVADWRVSNLSPPLDLADASFDLIQLASVFTHLPLPIQRAWLAELKRLVRPGGAVVITLHGEIYARLMLDEDAQEAYRNAGGYAEFAAAEPGANAFSTFHSRDFAEQLFGEHFRDIHWFPRGNHTGRPTLFPFAALQDAYILGA